jgi:hypothetical protein
MDNQIPTFRTPVAYSVSNAMVGTQMSAYPKLWHNHKEAHTNIILASKHVNRCGKMNVTKSETLFWVADFIDSNIETLNCGDWIALDSNANSALDIISAAIRPCTSL